MAFLNETGLKTFLRNCDNRYLRLTGGTVNGEVTATQLKVKSPTQDLNNIVSTSVATWGSGIFSLDKNGQRIGSFETYQAANSKTFHTIYGASIWNKTYYQSCTIGSYTNIDGSDAGYDISHIPEFRKAIGVLSGSSVPTSGGNGTIFIQV